MSSIYYRSVRRDSEDFGFANGLNSKVVIPDFVLGAESLTDPGFESWSIEDEPDDWDISADDCVKLTGADVRTGTYALGLLPNHTMRQELTDLSDDLVPVVYAKTSESGELNFKFYYIDAETYYYFNFSGDAAGTWTATNDQDPNTLLTINSIGATYGSLSFGGNLPIESTSVVMVVWSTVGQVDIDDMSFIDSVSSVEKLSNGGFENWTQYDVLDDWDSGQEGEDGIIVVTDSSMTKEDTEIYSGTYSAKLTSGEDSLGNAVYHLLAQSVANIDDPFIKFTIYSKNGTGAGNIFLVSGEIDGDNDDEEYQKIYNFTGANAGTWTLSGPEGPNADQTYTITGATEWTQVVLDNIPVPISGTIFTVLTSPSTAGQTCYFDLASFKIYSRAAIQPATFKTDLDIKDLLRGDAFLLTQYEDSTSIADNPAIAGKFVPFATYNDTRYNRLGIYTEKSGYMFVSETKSNNIAPIMVGAATEPQDATNMTNSLTVLATVGTTDTPIDFTAVAETELYTVPNNYSLFLDRIDFEITSDTYTSGWVGGIGSGDNHTDFAQIADTFSINIVGEGSLIGTSTNLPYIRKHRYGSGQTIILDITTGATATELTGIIRVIGYLVREE